MLSRKNLQEQLKKNEPQKQQFAIKKLTVGVASVLLGVTFAGTVSADTTDANSASGSANDSSEQTNHQLNLADANVATMKQATAANTQQGSSAAVVNTAGDLATPVADSYQTVVDNAMSAALDSASSAIASDAGATSANQAVASVASQSTSVAASDKTVLAPKTEIFIPTTVADADHTIQNQPVVAQPTSTATNTNENVNETYTVKVTLKNIARADGNLNLNPNWPVNRGWVYNFKNQVLELKDVKDNTRVYSLGLAPTGFKLMNPEVLTQYFRMDGNTAYVDGKDADVTLEYAPISPILVKYVDEDTGEVLSSSSVGANTSTSASREYELGDPTAISQSKFLVKAIDIPGYEVDGDSEIIENYTNVQSLHNPNYQVVTFKYKKIMDNPNPKDSQKGSGAQYGEYFGPSWNTIDPADIFNVSGVKGQTYDKDNGDMEARMNGIISKYQNQGYTYMGTFNYHKNTDFYNWNEGGTSINLIPNKPVTVKYVDEQGNALAPEEILAKNPNNPDQTNNGINEAGHWYSAGEWEATAKDFAGYALRTTYGATKGNYTPYKYVVTFEYAKNTTGKVIYIDDTDKQTLQTDDLTGFVGDKIDYSTANSIADFEKQGYVLVSDNFSADKVYQDSVVDNTFEVHFTHGVQPVTPTTPPTDVADKTPAEAQPDQLTKQVNLTVKYVNADGTQFTGTIPANARQTATFTGTAYVDKVTGKLVNAKQEDGKWVIDTANTTTPQITWTSDKTSFDGVTSPVEKGYHVTNVSSHADGDNVAAITGLTKDTENIAITVTYKQNGTEVRNGKEVKASQLVKYVDENGNELSTAKKQNFTFIYTGDTFDSYTGEKLATGTWNEQNTAFTAENVPVIDGYVAAEGYTNHDGAYTAGGFITTPGSTDEDRNKVFTVVYKQVGKIVPVGPDGKTPVPDAPTPSYPNDPTDPTAVTPNEPVPEVPGWRPSVPTITPDKPTEDTPVIYNQIQKADLTIVDQDNNNQQIVISGITTKFNATDGIAGETISFTGIGDAINALESRGYEYVNSDFKLGDVFDNDATTDQHFTITMKHGTEPVDPEHPGAGYRQTDLQKDVTRTVHFVNAENGTKVAEPVAQTAHFTANGTLDKVTGQLVTVVDGKITGPGALIWTPAQDMAAVQSPVINGMHVSDISRDADGTNVKGVSLTHNDDSYDVYVNYVANGTVNQNGQNIPASQTIKFVDEDGNTLQENNVQTSEFTRTPDVVDAVTGEMISAGSWNETSHQFMTINVPVIDGYVAEVTTAGGLTATIDNPNVVTEVVYRKVGKIVPVDPDGKPIPDAPTPSYPNDPTDPTAVTPDEPVPSIPGWIPEVPTVTPTNPGVDTPVVYHPQGVDPKPVEDQKAVVNYIDEDANNAQIATSGELLGKPDTKINYSTADTIKELEARGYVLVTDGFPADATFDNDSDVEQVFTVVLKHGHAPVGPKDPHEPNTPVNPDYPEGPTWPAKDTYEKEYTSTVHFVDNNGNKMHDDDVQTSTWGRTLIIDKVTGQILNPDEAWTTDQPSYHAVKVPVINGYVADKAVVAAKKTVQRNLEETVTYTKVGNIVPVDPNGNPIPDAPVVPYTNDPTDPTKVVPNEPVPEVPGRTPNVTTVTPTDPTVDTPVIYTTPTPVTPETDTPEPAQPATPAEVPATPATPETPAQPAAPQAETPAPAKEAPAQQPAKQEAKTLPQTGNDHSNSAAVLGLAALGLTGMVAAGKKRRKED